MPPLVEVKRLRAGGRIDADATRSRSSESRTTLRRTDAIAKMSLLPTLCDRLTAAEQELARLNAAYRQSPTT